MTYVNGLRIEYTPNNKVVITDDWLTDYVIFYDDGTWRCDGVFGHNRESLGTYICNKLDLIAKNRMRDGE